MVDIAAYRRAKETILVIKTFEILREKIFLFFFFKKLKLNFFFILKIFLKKI